MMTEHIRQSNLIESIDDPEEDARSLIAWKYIENQRKIGIPNILTLHGVVTKNQLPPEESGYLRTIMVTVGGQIPPTPFLAHQMLYNWCMDMHEYGHRLDPKVMHVRFERIHPFVDGNGRVGRMLMWWHEKQLGLEPTLILEANKNEYYKWF